MSLLDPNMQLNAKQLLREDDSLLRQVFFNVLKHHHPQLAAKVRSCVWLGVVVVGCVAVCVVAQL